VEVSLLNSIKPQLLVSPASPDYAILRAAAVRERSEVNADNSPEEALRREIKALHAGRVKYNIELKKLVSSFARIREISARNELMRDRVARMKLDLSTIKKARNVALDSRRRARQARARAIAERINVANVRVRFGTVAEVRRGVQGLRLDETKEQGRSFRGGVSGGPGVGTGNDGGDMDEDDDLAMGSGEELGGTSQDERDAAEDEGIEEETEEDRAFTTPHAGDEARLR
jgi:hypothetical protein